MIKISQNEASWLRENHRGQDIHISSVTHKSKGKRYYLTTTAESMRLLSEYRSSHGYGEETKSKKKRG